jgi:hypothetical protein
VRRAAALVGRHPETIRRWVWTGRIDGRRSGNRLLVARHEVEAVARQDARAGSLRGWADAAHVARRSGSRSDPFASAADLVIEDRNQRSGTVPTRASH